ncbi:MAG: hypothetical protein K8U57_39550 [Planctomycetes bacterium]|nr:hypothetical protein [Planctomycetota bacterium]
MSTFRFSMFLVLIPIPAFVATSEWGTSIVFDTCEPQTLYDDYRKELELAKQLEASDQEVLRRIEVQEMLAWQLITRRVSLAEVTNQFLMMHQNHPACMAAIRAEFPGNSDEEKIARKVIGCAVVEVSRSNPDRKAEVLARLESEFECFVAANQNAVP